MALFRRTSGQGHDWNLTIYGGQDAVGVGRRLRGMHRRITGNESRRQPVPRKLDEAAE